MQQPSVNDFFCEWLRVNPSILFPLSLKILARTCHRLLLSPSLHTLHTNTANSIKSTKLTLVYRHCTCVIWSFSRKKPQNSSLMLLRYAAVPVPDCQFLVALTESILRIHVLNDFRRDNSDFSIKWHASGQPSTLLKADTTFSLLRKRGERTKHHLVLWLICHLQHDDSDGSSTDPRASSFLVQVDSDPPHKKPPKRNVCTQRAFK